MKTIATLMILLCSQTFAADFSHFERLIERKMGAGTVQVTNVTSHGPTDFVTFEMMSFGELQESWCVVKGNEAVQCMDDSIHRKTAH
jgi:hypothetical protein